MPYLREFLGIAAVFLVALVSPGADFAMVVRQALAHGRAAGLWTSLGIASGLGVHIAYCIAGLALVIARSPAAFRTFKFAGAAYLLWLGVQAILHARPRRGEETDAPPPAAPSRRRAFAAGFLTNLLNPKAALLLLAMFSVGVARTTPTGVQGLYGAWMVVTCLAWFALVATVFAQRRVRDAFLALGCWLERLTGAVFIGFAVRLALATQG